MRRPRLNRRVLDALTEKDFHEAFQKWRDGGTGVYVRDGTTSRVMAADRSYDEFYDVYSVSPEHFGYHHVAKGASRLF
jgi:hypothetical protein